MDLKVIKERYTDFLYDEYTDLERLNYIKKFKNSNLTNLKLTESYDNYRGHISMVVEYERIETKREYRKRLKEEKKAIKRKEKGRIEDLEKARVSKELKDLKIEMNIQTRGHY